MQRAQRRPHVLIEKHSVVARKLKAEPGVWWLVGIGEKERARVLAQTAFRISKGTLKDFTQNDTGYFEAMATADQSRPDPIAPVEAYARYCLRN